MDSEAEAGPGQTCEMNGVEPFLGSRARWRGSPPATGFSVRWQARSPARRQPPGGRPPNQGYSRRPSAIMTNAGKTNKIPNVAATRPPNMLTTNGTKAIRLSLRS